MATYDAIITISIYNSIGDLLASDSLVFSDIERGTPVEYDLRTLIPGGFDLTGEYIANVDFEVDGEIADSNAYTIAYVGGAFLIISKKGVDLISVSSCKDIDLGSLSSLKGVSLT